MANIGNVDLTSVTVANAAVVDDCDMVDTMVVGSGFSCSGIFSLTWLNINSGATENTVR